MGPNAAAQLWSPRSRRLVVGAVLLAAAAGVAIASVAGRTTDPAERLAQARDLVFAGRPRAAMRQTLRALADLGDDGNLALREEALARAAQIADFHLSDAHIPEALGYYQKLVRLSPRSPAAFDAGQRIAEILHQRLHDNLHAEAQELAVVEGFPHQAGVERLLVKAARLALAGRRYEAARSDAGRLLSAYPTSPFAPDAQLVVGQAFQLEGRLHEATQAFDALSDRWPGTPIAARALYQAGNCLADEADYGHAIARYIEALPDHPDPTEVQESLDRARRHFTALSEMKPGSHAYAFARNH